MMTRYVHSYDGITAELRVYETLPSPYDKMSKVERMENGWYDAIINPPESVDGETYAVNGFHRVGDDFVADFMLLPKVPAQEDEATEADKDAALQTLGVDMTENGGAE